MDKRIMGVIVTVIFVDLTITMIDRSNRITDFIPLLSVISSRQLGVEAYDFFVLLSLIILKIIFVHYRINRATLRYIPSLFQPANPKELIVLAVAGIISHFCLFPWLIKILSDPFTTIMHSPDPIRKTVIVTTPFIWLLTITMINRGAHAEVLQSSHSLQFPMWWKD